MDLSKYVVSRKKRKEISEGHKSIKIEILFSVILHFSLIELCVKKDEGFPTARQRLYPKIKALPENLPTGPGDWGKRDVTYPSSTSPGRLQQFQ